MSLMLWQSSTFVFDKPGVSLASPLGRIARSPLRLHRYASAVGRVMLFCYLQRSRKSLSLQKFFTWVIRYPWPVRAAIAPKSALAAERARATSKP